MRIGGALPLALLLAASSARATPEPIVFDFEDGLQGWELSGSAERVQTQVLGGEWAIFADGNILGSAISLGGVGEFDLTGVDSVSVEIVLIAGDEDGLFLSYTLNILDVLLLGEAQAFPVQNSAEGSALRRVAVPSREVRDRGIGISSPIRINWHSPRCPLVLEPCPFLPPHRETVALIDNITFHPVPEPRYLGVLGLLGVLALRRVRRR